MDKNQQKATDMLGSIASKAPIVQLLASCKSERDRLYENSIILEGDLERANHTIARLTAERDEISRAFDAACKSADRYREALKRIRDDAVDSMRINTVEDREAASELESSRQAARAARPASDGEGVERVTASSIIEPVAPRKTARPGYPLSPKPKGPNP